MNHLCKINSSIMNRKPQILLIYSLLFFVFINTSLISCSQDEELIDLVGIEDPKEEPKEPNEEGNGEGEETDPETDGSEETDNESDFDSTDGLKISTTPCDFLLSDATSNSTIEIDCQMDLKGQTINLPAGVTLTYAGGEIINGTLNFSVQGIIDGNLLNKDLDIEGDVQLSSQEFNFYPERWDIVQGEGVTSGRALQNNTNFEGLIYLVKDLGANVFLVDKFDAYFEVTKVTSSTSNQNFYPSLEAINIPSNFTLSMTDNTILRVFPTENLKSAALLAIREVENVKIIGGVLYGDRDLRQYSKTNAEEGAHLLNIHSGTNIVLDGIKFTMGSLGGLNINSIGHSFQPIYNPSNNIIVRSCVFDSNRMMSIAITDGNNIDINGNTFLKNGLPSTNSDGGVVGYAINFEPVRKRDSETQELVEYQKVYNVTIRNNKESQSRAGAVIIYIGQNIVIENNEFEGRVGYTFASDTEIRNNKFIASPNSADKPAIGIGGSGETVFNNKVHGNTIEGYGVGISSYYKGVEISGNIINNCSSGIQFKEAEDIVIKDNKISNSNGGNGITGHITTANNVQILNNEINVRNNSLFFVQLNGDLNSSTESMIVKGNTILGVGPSVFSNSSGILYEDNNLLSGVQISNSSNVDILNNTITPTDRHGIQLKGNVSNIVVSDNDIKVATKYDCIRDESSGSVSIGSNTCQ